MAIELRSSSTAASATPALSLAVPKPAGLANGDVLVLSVAMHTDSATGVTSSFSCPGFTDVPGVSTSSTLARNITSLYKVITDAASEPASYTVTTSDSGSVLKNLAGGATAWTGVDTTTPLDVTSAAPTSGTSLTVTAPEVTTVTAGACLIHQSCCRRALTFTPDAAMTEVVDIAASGGAAGNLVTAHLAYQLLGAAGLTGSRTATESGATPREFLTVLFALRPASGSGVTVNGGLASETDTAHAGTAAVRPAGTQASETDTASPGAPAVRITGALSTESDTALAGTVAVRVAGTQASETDTALTGSPAVRTAGSLASTTESALPGAQATAIVGSLAEQVEQALAGLARVTVAGALATETDLAFAGTVASAATVKRGVGAASVRMRTSGLAEVRARTSGTTTVRARTRGEASVR